MSNLGLNLFKKVQTNFITKLERFIVSKHVLFALSPIFILIYEIQVSYCNNLFQVFTGCDTIVRQQTSVTPTPCVTHCGFLKQIVVMDNS